MIYLNLENFKEEVVDSDKPVLVDFYADWCGPCKMMGPIIDEISETVDTVKVCKLNVDEARDIAMEYGVMSIPTLILFKNGQVAEKSVGAVAKQAIMELISK